MRRVPLTVQAGLMLVAVLLTGTRAGISAPAEEFDFIESWRPYFLYVSDNALLVPVSRSRVATVPSAEGTITALAATPSGITITYAVTSPTASRIVSTTASGGASKVVADADTLGEDLWFHGFMWLSPNKRWLVVGTSSGRGQIATRGESTDTGRASGVAASEGDVWVIDSVGRQQPRRVLSRAHLLSCVWAWSGRHAVCEIARPCDGRLELMLLDADQGETQEILLGPGRAVWSTDSATVWIYTCRDGMGTLGTYRIPDRQLQAVSTLGAWTGFPPEAVWSPDGTVCAWVESGAAKPTISLCLPSGRRRTVPAPAEVAELLGWSWGNELLSYITTDGRIHFCAGTVSDASYERLISALPQGSEVEGQPSARESISMQTTRSPVKVNAPDGLAVAWTRDAHERCFVYVDVGEEEGQDIWAIHFSAKSVEDLGIDRRQDVREQAIRKVSTSNLRQVGLALRRYADDHDGKLPPHATGIELVNDLKEYVPDASVLSSPYGEGEVRVRLLLPGADWRSLERELAAEALASTAIAELRSDDGFVFVFYADGHVGAVDVVNAP